jgi:hypothetical protein
MIHLITGGNVFTLFRRKIQLAPAVVATKQVLAKQSADDRSVLSSRDAVKRA